MLMPDLGFRMLPLFSCSGFLPGAHTPIRLLRQGALGEIIAAIYILSDAENKNRKLPRWSR